MRFVVVLLFQQKEHLEVEINYLKKLHNTNKPWFDKICHTARKKNHLAKR